MHWYPPPGDAVTVWYDPARNVFTVQHGQTRTAYTPDQLGPSLMTMLYTRSGAKRSKEFADATALFIKERKEREARATATAVAKAEAERFNPEAILQNDLSVFFGTRKR